MRNPYDSIAEQFHANRKSFREKKYLDMVLNKLEPGACVLDLGCGTGRPIAEHMIKRGFRVIGVDRSKEMLAIAKKVVPTAQLVQAELEYLELRDKFSVIIVWDSLFHIERRHHKAIYIKLRHWLVDGGMLLLSSGGSGDEGFTGQMYDHEFFYSSYAPEEVIKFLEEAGFRIIIWEVDDPSAKGHIAIVARANRE